MGLSPFNQLSDPALLGIAVFVLLAGVALAGQFKTPPKAAVKSEDEEHRSEIRIQAVMWGVLGLGTLYFWLMR